MRPCIYLVPGRDNVATAVRPLAPGDSVEVEAVGLVTLREAIPFGHKFAVAAIRTGEAIVKYGHSIGQATRSITPGEHVHVHNVAGKRGRGDLQEAVRTGETDG
jgi:altronate dehydratase small subunit